MEKAKQKGTDSGNVPKRRSTRESGNAGPSKKKNKNKNVNSSDEEEPESLSTPDGRPIIPIRSLEGMEADELERLRKMLHGEVVAHPEAPGWLPRECALLWPSMHRALCGAAGLKAEDFQRLVYGGYLSFYEGDVGEFDA